MLIIKPEYGLRNIAWTCLSIASRPSSHLLKVARTFYSTNADLHGFTVKCNILDQVWSDGSGADCFSTVD